MAGRARAPARFRVHTVGPVLAHVGDRGGDVTGLRRAAGLPARAADAPWLELPLAQIARFYELAAAAAADPLLGAHVGQALTRQVWDVMQVSCLAAPDLRRGLALLPRLIPLFNDAVELAVRDAADRTVTVEHRIPGAPEALSRHGNELWLAALLTRAREATGAAIVPVACWFAHRAPAGVAALTRALALPAPTFAAGATGVTLAAADVDRPLRTGDPVLLAVLDRLVEPRLAVAAGRRGVAAEVCHAIEAELADGVPTLTRTARRLGRSSRALQRELAAAATTYRALIDHVRRTAARALLAVDTPLDDVAARLGYSERSAFVRAFARWRGRRAPG